MMTINRIATAAVCLLSVVVTGCAASPDKSFETGSMVRKVSARNAPAAEPQTVSQRPSLADRCLQRHVDYQAGRNQPATLEEKRMWDWACTSAVNR